MNSSQGTRGFITFLILFAILVTGVVGFNYVSTPTNTTSQAGEPKTEPLNVAVNGVTDSSVNITWATIDSSTSKLIYSKNLNAACLSSVDSTTQDCQFYDEAASQTSHTVKLINLEQETTYFFRILTNEKYYPPNANHTFRTAKRIMEPVKQQSTPPSVKAPAVNDFSGFGSINTTLPNAVKIKPNSDEDKVLGASDKNVPEPVDPLANIDTLVQAEFREALTYNDMRYDFNKDGKVTMADYPLFIEFVMNYEE